MSFEEYQSYTNTYLAKITKMVLLVCKSFPVHQQTTGTTTTANALTSATPFRLDYVAKYDIKFRVVPHKRAEHKFVQNGIIQRAGPYSYQQQDAANIDGGQGDE